MKQGWQTKTIGELFETGSGGTPLKMHKEYYEGGDIPWLRSGEVCKKYITETELFITRKGLENSSAKFFPPNSVVVAMYGATAGQVGILKMRTTTNQAVCGIFPSADYVPEFVYYSLLSKQKELVSQATGNAQPNISQIKIKNVSIPLLPLSEQQRIVALLDAEFAKIDALKANAEKNLQNAKDLFISTLSKELKHREGWKETKIGEFCEIIRGKRFVRADIVEEGVPCIHYGDIYTHYGLFATKAKGCVSPVLAKKLRFANKNDVIVVAAGENRFDIGVGVAWLGDEPAVVHDACFILKHSQNPMFLSFYLRSAEYHQYLKDEVNEGKICSFLTKPLAEAKISLPSLEEQEQIVKRLEIVSTNCKAIQENTSVQRK